VVRVRQLSDCGRERSRRVCDVVSDAKRSVNKVRQNMCGFVSISKENGTLSR